MCVAWIRYEIERGHHRLPSPRSERWPNPTIPHASSRRKRPSPSCSASSTTLTLISTPVPALRIHKAPLGLGSHRPLPAAARCGKRTLLLARCSEVLLPPVSWGGGAAPFLVPSEGKEAQAFFGASAKEILSELVGDPETLLVDSTLLSVLHPRQVPQSAGFPGRRG